MGPHCFGCLQVLLILHQNRLFLQTIKLLLINREAIIWPLFLVRAAIEGVPSANFLHLKISAFLILRVSISSSVRCILDGPKSGVCANFYLRISAKYRCSFKFKYSKCLDRRLSFFYCVASSLSLNIRGGLIS